MWRGRPAARRLSTMAILCALAVGARAGGDAPAAPAPDPGAVLTAEIGKAFAPFTQKLVALGEWCDGSKLLLERSRVAEALVLLDPDNERARAWLRYRRDKDGSWRQTSASLFADEAPALLPEWERRRAEIAVPMRAALAPFLDRRRDWRTRGPRDRVLRALVAMNPDDADLRDADGETLVGGRWLLKESASTADRRKWIRDAVADATRDGEKAAKKLAQAPSEFASCVGTTEFTVVSSMPLAASTAMAAKIIAARLVFERVFDVASSYRAGFAVHLFANEAESVAYLATRFDLSEADKRYVANRGTYWLKGGQLVVCSDTAALRDDHCVREVFSSLRGTTLELMTAPAWMGEGFGMYLTHALLGTRLTVFVNRTDYSDDATRKDLADVKADWVQAVRRLVLDKSVAPNLRVLTGLPLNSMTADDTLMAYALAAYFLEGRPSDARRLLMWLRQGSSFHRSLAILCDVDVDGLEARFIRWLRETR